MKTWWPGTELNRRRQSFQDSANPRSVTIFLTNTALRRSALLHKQMPPFQWEDIDHSLASLKLTESAEDMHRKIKEDEARIQFENRHNLNDNAIPSLVLRMKQEHADAQAQQVYEIYCDVWRTQGHAKSAAFVRAVSARAIRAMLRARAGAIAGEFVRFAKRTSFPETIRDAHMLAHRLKMQRLQSRWERRLEAEAKECEHAERIESLRSKMPAGDSFAIKTVPDTLGNAPADEIRREAIIKKIQNPQTNTILSVQESALYFGVMPRTVHRWTDEGKLRRGARRGSITIESILRWEKKRSRKRSPQ